MGFGSAWVGLGMVLGWVWDGFGILGEGLWEGSDKVEKSTFSKMSGNAFPGLGRPGIAFW